MYDEKHIVLKKYRKEKIKQRKIDKWIKGVIEQLFIGHYIDIKQKK